jgi:hypothetical protein
MREAVVEVEEKTGRLHVEATILRIGHDAKKQYFVLSGRWVQRQNIASTVYFFLLIHECKS